MVALDILPLEMSHVLDNCGLNQYNTGFNKSHGILDSIPQRIVKLFHCNNYSNVSSATDDEVNSSFNHGMYGTFYVSDVLNEVFQSNDFLWNTPRYHKGFYGSDLAFALKDKLLDYYVFMSLTRSDPQVGWRIHDLSLKDGFLDGRLDTQMSYEDIESMSVIESLALIKSDTTRSYIDRLLRFIVNVVKEVQGGGYSWDVQFNRGYILQAINRDRSFLFSSSVGQTGNLMPEIHTNSTPFANSVICTMGALYNPAFCNRFSTGSLYRGDIPRAYVWTNSIDTIGKKIAQSNINSVNVNLDDISDVKIVFDVSSKTPSILLGEGVGTLDISDVCGLDYTENKVYCQGSKIKSMYNEIKNHIDGWVTLKPRVTILHDRTFRGIKAA